MHRIKKWATVFLLVYCPPTVLLCAAQWNYTKAMRAAWDSCGSDACIEEAMLQYGFDVEWHRSVTTWDKVKALF